MSKTKSELARAIALLRKRAGMTQEKLALELELTKGAVGQWESGASAPTPEHAVGLCTLVGVRPWALKVASDRDWVAALPKGTETTMITTAQVTWLRLAQDRGYSLEDLIDDENARVEVSLDHERALLGLDSDVEEAARRYGRD